MAAWDRDPGRSDLVVLTGLAPAGQPPLAVVLGCGQHGDDRRLRLARHPQAAQAPPPARTLTTSAARAFAGHIGLGTLRLVTTGMRIAVVLGGLLLVAQIVLLSIQLH